jgi:protein-S-isoprenylcysteine O-methyltransferase Ste14
VNGKERIMTDEHEAHHVSRGQWVFYGFLAIAGLLLLTEMYGFPLTIYLLSGWLTNRIPGFDPFSHDAGHLLEDLFGWCGNPHFGPFHLLSNVLIVAGFFLLSAAWKVLYRAQRRHMLATTGPYAKIRHPQYAGFVMIMFGFLLQWPTIITALMFPVQVFMYVRLARTEEEEARAAFGEAYDRYASAVPAFFPHFSILH